MTEAAQMPRTLLLVDDEPNIINALKRTLRRDGYQIVTANSAAEGLNLLAEHNIGVIVSDQRMPLMTGVDFLRKVKELYPRTLRMVLSGYTDLESVTSAINEGAIYRFMTKPWDDEQIRNNIRQAFEHHEMEQQNQRLTEELRRANVELSVLNQNLEQNVMQKTREMVHNINMLEISQEILEHLPVAIIGIDEHRMIVASNHCADQLFRNSVGRCLPGSQIDECLPASLLPMLQHTTSASSVELNGFLAHLEDGVPIHVWISPMGKTSRAKGTIMVFSPIKES